MSVKPPPCRSDGPLGAAFTALKDNCVSATFISSSMLSVTKSDLTGTCSAASLIPSLSLIVSIGCKLALYTKVCFLYSD